MWTQSDFEWAKERQLNLDELERQMARFRSTSTIPIDRPAVLGDGIHPLDEWTPGRELPIHRVVSFVPASGAATRMFKALVQAHAHLPDSLADLDTPALRPAFLALRDRVRLPFPARDTWKNTLRSWLEEHELHRRPKGLVPLHRYGSQVCTAVDEHVAQLKDLGGDAIHLTVSPEHRHDFEKALPNGPDWTSTTSLQHPSTDTIALDENGDLFRLPDGTPLLRPGGHGALLRNLQELDADWVLVRNIDNVARRDRAAVATQSRRRMLAMLERIEADVHRYLRNLVAGEEPMVAIDFAKATFGRTGRGETAMEMAHDALHRPLRIVGVVANTGAPGGGPFWTVEPNGSVTPQIVESAQVADTEDQRQRFGSASHFNPVDMVLSMRDVDGNPFDLADFVDDRGWIRASKSFDGRPLQALERPGLWNGGMSGWNTVFVELPEGCFHPVKTVADLLAPGHVEPGTQT